MLSDPDSPHTVRWANSLSNKGLQVFLFGLCDYNAVDYSKEVSIRLFKTPENIKGKLRGNFIKSVYLLALPKLKKFISEVKPDIIHAHYAASYGLLGALTGFHPFILSVWGIDILTFPGISVLHKSLIRFALNKADQILATSSYLKEKTNLLTNKEVNVTPFGVDTDKFRPAEKLMEQAKDEIVIGNIKSLEGKYGIDTLLKTFKIVLNSNPGLKVRLLLVGGGSLENEFRKLSKSLNVEKNVTFAGRINPGQIYQYHNMIDIEVYLSTVESFGVSVLEASASGNPVVVSDVGGLSEVIVDGVTGFKIPAGDPPSAAAAIQKLIIDKSLREKMGKAGREFVLRKYQWKKSVENMLKIYENIIK